MQFKATTRTHYRLPSPAAFAGGGVALIVLVIGSLWLAESPEPVRSPAPVALPRLAAPTTPRQPTPQPSGPVYRHSVIPGGVHGAAGLASILARDPVASVHYANFDVARASMVKVAKSRLVHVSYRIGDKIYWTKSTVRLAAGEELLTDGVHLVRSRCGNRIADARQAIESDNEPAPEVLDALMVSADDLPDDTENLANTSGGVANGVANFTAPAAILLASSAQAAAPLPVGAAPDLVSWDTTPHTTLRTTLPASPPVPAQAAPAAPAQPGHGDDDVPAVAGSAPSPPSTTPSSSSTPVVTLAGPLAHSGEPAAAATPARPAMESESAAPIPEPGSAALALAALVALSLARRRAISRK
jgi:MYXO-CTERM domain-containing protein